MTTLSGRVAELNRVEGLVEACLADLAESCPSGGVGAPDLRAYLGRCGFVVRPSAWPGLAQWWESQRARASRRAGWVARAPFVGVLVVLVGVWWAWRDRADGGPSGVGVVTVGLLVLGLVLGVAGGIVGRVWVGRLGSDWVRSRDRLPVSEATIQWAGPGVGIVPDSRLGFWLVRRDSGRGGAVLVLSDVDLWRWACLSHTIGEFGRVLEPVFQDHPDRSERRLADLAGRVAKLRQIEQVIVTDPSNAPARAEGPGLIGPATADPAQAVGPGGRGRCGRRWFVCDGKGMAGRGRGRHLGGRK